MPTIDVPHKFDKFYRHLNLDPTRVLFSGPFGSGKTTFLNNFFTEYNNDYAIITVYPVNYSVASNNDIFDLLKYDIIIELLKTQEIDLERCYYFSDETVQKILHSSVLLAGMFASIVESTSEIGKVLKLGGKASNAAIKNFSDILNSVNKNEGKELLQFIKDQEARIGVYENSQITKLIGELINRYTDNRSRKSILVIDDLDRLDPDHIFRLLNVFSSYHDASTDYHKLGFDMVLISCDVSNIKSVFHHKYGLKADFDGYINKFFNNEIFQFNLIDGLINKLDDIIPELKSEGGVMFKIELSKSYSQNYFNQMINYLLVGLIQCNELKIRTLKSKSSSIFNLPKYEVNLSSIGNNYNNQFGVLMVVDFFKWLFDCDLITLIEKFKKSSDKHDQKYSLDVVKSFIAHSLIILDNESNNLKPIQSDSIQGQYKWTQDNKRYYYSFNRAPHENYWLCHFIALHNDKEEKLADDNLKFTPIFTELLRVISFKKITPNYM